jgi:hypothetical protein
MQGGSGEYGSVSSDEPVTDTNRTFDIEIKPLIDYAPHQTQCEDAEAQARLFGIKKLVKPQVFGAG